jgi:nucleotide-binding universal stress UspA family protein
MKSILIAVDFGEGSLNSCKYTIEIAPKNMPVSIWLFHVYADQFIFQPSYEIDGVLTDPVVDMEFFNEMKKISQQSLDNLKNELLIYIEEKGYTNFTIKDFMVQGDPQWAITDVCEESKPDLIVMSTYGAGKKEPLEGNMAKRIIGKTSVPVLAVPSNYHNYKLKNIMYTTNLDNDEEDIKITKIIIESFSYFDITVYFTFFKEKSEYKNKIDSIKEALKNEIENNKLKLLFENEYHNETSIKAIAEENNIDLVAFVPHKSNIFKLLFNKGISKHDLFAAGLPLLGIPSV